MTDELERLAAGVVQGSFTGPVVPDWLARRIDAGLGSVCLFGSNLKPVSAPASPAVEPGPDAAAPSGIVATAHVARRLHALRPSLVVAVDEEGGDVTRLEADRGSSVPGNAALGAVGDPELTRSVSASLGRLLRAVGVDLDLAPCVDINSSGNPAIGVRSFSSDPEAVASHAAAAVSGLQSVGVAACAKHFPGHGATAVDSHLGLPTVDAGGDLLRGRELAPFRAAIAAGVASVMVGHLRVPAFDTQLPATISPRIITGLLREELGYEGVVITDALDMAGIGGPEHIPANVARAIAAGADLCCLGPDATDDLIGACVDAVTTAVRSGELEEQRLDQAANRVASLEGLRETRPPSGKLAEAVAELEEVGAQAADRSLQVDGQLPATLRGALVVELGRPPMIAAGRVPWGVGEPWAAIDSSVTHERLDDAADVGRALGRGTGRPLVVVTRDPQQHPDRLALAEALRVARPDVVVVDMGWPADGLPGPRVRSFGASRAVSGAVARLFLQPPPSPKMSDQEDESWPR